eukprot:symbB.v1.2.004187.t1/scaffold233.1/size288367/18
MGKQLLHRTHLRETKLRSAQEGLACIELHCGTNNTCSYIQPEDTDFRPGSRLKVYAEVFRREPEGGLASYICPSMVAVSFAGFGCQEGALLSFGLAHLAVIFFTLFLAIMVELFLRRHIDVFLEVAVDVSSSNELAPLPSSTESWCHGVSRGRWTCASNVMRASSADTCDDSEDESLLPQFGLQSQQLRTHRNCLVCLGVSLVAAVSLICLRSLSEETLEPFAQRQSAPVRAVEEVYTFGTPGSSKSILSDVTHEDGCFGGLRVYMRSARPGWGAVDTPVYDPVAWITQQFSYRHARMRFLELWELNLYQGSISPCSASIQDPPSDTFWWIEGHVSYEAALKHHLQAAKQALPQDLKAATSELNDLQKAYLMCHFTFVIYAPEMATLHVDAKEWGWTLVGYASSLPSEPRDDNSIVTFHDHAALFQHPRSLECVLAFEGSDRADLSDWVYDAEIAPVTFCGFTEVHRGFKEKLMAMLESDDFDQAIRVKLPYCSKLITAGHSMGGAQAELFSACANRHRPHHDMAALKDQKLVTFESKKPVALTPYLSEQVPGVVLRNGLNNLCLDAVGLVQAAHDQQLQVGLCHDQRQQRQHWRLEGGRVISELAGLCMTVQSNKDDAVIQAPCLSRADGRVLATHSTRFPAEQVRVCGQMSQQQYEAL